MSIQYAEAALQRCSHENAPRKLPPNPQDNIHAKVRPQQSHRAALLKPDPNSGSLLQTHCTNSSEHSTTRAHQKACIRVYSKIQINLK